MRVDPLLVVCACVVAWAAIGALALVRPHATGFISRILFPLGALVALVVAAAAIGALAAPPRTLVVPLGLPDLPFHLRLDALAALFLALLGIATFAVSLFSVGYFRAGEGMAPGLVAFQYHVFVAAMATVIVADDAYLFMVAWEVMALASYFLVITEHRIAEIRSAGFLYLFIAHVGAVGILLCFGVLQGGTGDYTFDGMRAAHLTGAWPSIGFLLAVFGFGAKAGLLPLHVWLPEAHPAAPSPVSALMSGVMLKTAIYALVRVTFDLLHTQVWWWGVVLICLGLVTALFGVIFAAAQTDMKRLLAYSSIENIGIIAAGVGLALLFSAHGKALLAAVALTAALYHCLNHAMFKTLLFLATGAVLHATRERSLGKLGGLIRKMPWVALFALVGTLAIAGLPPLNGFVSEWLLLQAFLFTPSLPQSFVNMLVPLAAAALVLAAALAAYVMVKFYGVVFLGRPREPSLAGAHDPGSCELAALGWLALACLALGVLPTFVIGALDPIDAMLVGSTVSHASGASWLVLAPIDADRASYAPLVMLVVIVAVVLLSIQIVHRFYHGRVQRAIAWNCGSPEPTPRMQDSAEGFGQPIRQVFEPFFRMTRHLPSPSDSAPRYAVTISDPVRYWLYLPIARVTAWVARCAGLIQDRRISVYLAFSFVTLIVLLFFVR
jgi:hydrogenase-4 component B